MTIVPRCTQQPSAHALISLVATLTLLTVAPRVRAQSQPGTPVFESVGYGAVRPWSAVGFAGGFALRPADAGGSAEFVTLSTWPSVHDIDRWKVTTDGVPYFAGYAKTAYHATAVTWADMDGDGSADLVCAEDGPNGVVIEILHDGSAGPVSPGHLIAFDQSYAIYPVGYVTVADVNGDGYPDIGVVSPDDDFGTDVGSLTWLLSQGGASFVTVRVAAGHFARPVVTRLDADSIPDLIEWEPQSLYLGLLQGSGDGRFNWTADVLPACGKPILTDLDGDGVRDIVAGKLLYRGVAAGVPQLVDSVTANATAFVDVDHDGVADLVSVQNGRIAVARGLGGFAFGSFASYAAGSIDDRYRAYGDGGVGPFEMSAVADMNGDGWSDVVGTSAYSGGRVVYAVPGLPGGAFNRPGIVQTGLQPTQVALADVLGGDGRADLIVLARGSRRLELRPGIGDGTFGEPEYAALPAGGRKLLVADLDGDGRPEVAVACDSSHTIRVFPGGAVDLAAPFDLTAGDALTDLRAADIDEDGHIDLLAATSTGPLASWRGDGALGFSPVAWDANLSGSDGRLQVGDVDGDGHVDIVVEDQSRFPSHLRFFSGDGHGHFGCDCGVASQVEPGTVFEPGELLADGRTFIAYVDTDSLGGFAHSYLRAFAGWGLEQQRLPAQCPEPNCDFSTLGYEVPPGPKQLMIADVTGDGILDAIVLSDVTSTLTVLPGLGGGAFGTPIAHIVGSHPTSFALGDVNGDGRLDAVVADPTTNEVTILRRVGNTTAGVDRPARPAGLGIHVASAPNAAELRLRLELPGSGTAQLDIFDVSGRRLVREQLAAAGAGERELTLDGSRLPRSGVYFVRLTQGAARASTRFTRFD